MTRRGGAARTADRDGELLAAAGGGNREAFDQLVRRRSATLTGVAYTMVAAADVDRLVAATWAAAWANRRRYHRRSDGAVLDWLIAHMAAAVVDLAPTHGAATAGIDDLAVVDTAQAAQKVAVADNIDAALRQLDRRDAALIRQRLLAENDWGSIRDTLGYRDIRDTQQAYNKAVAKLNAVYRPPPPAPRRG